jgi:HlyD family secretion protein
MLAKGYLSRAQISTEVSALRRAEFTLSRVQTEFRNFQSFEFPKNLRELESQIASARSNLSYQSLRLRGQEERLAQLQRQVAASTIRAPHDGLLIYAHKPKRDVRIEEGVGIRQNQDLFYLPDLSRLEVQVLLHETVVEQARPGMRARVRLEGAAGFLEGELSDIDPLPVVDRGKWSSGEVKNFVGRVQLHSSTQTLLPGMTAEVKITTANLHHALVIPAEAPLHENGRDVCYVLGRDGWEPRAVTLGQATGDWLEVIEGVSEGEEVALAAAFSSALPLELRESGQQGEFSPDAGPKP